MHTTHHLQYKKEKLSLIILSLPLWDFFKGLKNEFETVVVDEPSVFEPPKFYCIKLHLIVMCTPPGLFVIFTQSFGLCDFLFVSLNDEALLYGVQPLKK